MRYKRAVETTQNYLESQPLPKHGKSYTVISHKQVIDDTKNLFENSGFTIRKELDRANMNANVAQGIYHIYPSQTTDEDISKERELGMMFAWTNSYDKSTRFQCAIGAYVMVCNNGMVAGDMMNFKRKHTGSAGHDIKMQLSNQIKNGEVHYSRILKDRNALKSTVLTKTEQAALVGRLFIDEEIITSSQVSVIKKEINKPSYDYSTNDDNAWAFYNHVTHALKLSTPRDWLQDTQNFHDFMMSNVVPSIDLNALEEISHNKDYFSWAVDFGGNNGIVEIDEEVQNPNAIVDIAEI